MAPAALPASHETALRGGPFNSAVRELLSYYLSLEEYYMEETTAKVGRPCSITNVVFHKLFHNSSSLFHKSDKLFQYYCCCISHVLSQLLQLISEV